MDCLFTDKEYEHASAEAAEELKAMADVDLSGIEWPKRNRFEGASFSVCDDCSELFPKD